MNVLRCSDAASAAEACAARIVELLGKVLSGGPPEYLAQIAPQQADWYVA